MSAAEGFFYWGTLPVQQEVGEDLLTGLMQSKRSLFYNRDYGAGIPDFENTPISLVTIITMRLEVVKFFAIRNGRVTAGQIVGGIQYLDRRAATSQTAVNVVDEGGGGLFVEVPFFMLADVSSLKQVKTPIGGGGK